MKLKIAELMKQYPARCGDLPYLVAQAKEGDVLCIPAIRRVDDVHDFEYMFAVVLLVTEENRTLSRLFDQIEWCEHVVGTTVRKDDASITLIDDAGNTPEWCNTHDSVLLEGARKDLPDEYQWTFMPRKKVHVS